MSKPFNPQAAKMKPKTVSQALTLAEAYWDSSAKDARMMKLRAKAVAGIIGVSRELDSLGPSDGVLILTELAKGGKTKGTVKAYYAAFRRMLALSGIATSHWTNAPAPPRRVREPMLVPDVERMVDWFIGRAWGSTADLATILLHTGMRVEVEALSWTAWSLWDTFTGTGAALRIKGKGGHERVVPIPKFLWGILSDEPRMAAMRKLSYDGHLKRWRLGCAELGICTKLPTPHALRHLYATLAYERLDHNLVLVQQLLGHADVTTTAGYIGVSIEALSKGLSEDGND